ncbi:MAG: hypothetical protein ACYCOU_10770 [Sulfobacillus sp.]
MSTRFRQAANEFHPRFKRADYIGRFMLLVANKKEPTGEADSFLRDNICKIREMIAGAPADGYRIYAEETFKEGRASFSADLKSREYCLSFPGGLLINSFDPTSPRCIFAATSGN